jgi:hypothetical protein
LPFHLAPITNHITPLRSRWGFFVVWIDRLSNFQVPTASGAVISSELDPVATRSRPMFGVTVPRPREPEKLITEVVLQKRFSISFANFS